MCGMLRSFNFILKVVGMILAEKLDKKISEKSIHKIHWEGGYQKQGKIGALSHL